MGVFIMLLSLAAFVVGILGVATGRIRWAGIRSRKAGAAVLGGSLVAFVAGGLMLPTPEPAAVPAAAPAPTVTVTVTATVTVTPTPDPTLEPEPTPDPAASALEAAPEPTTAQPTIAQFAPLPATSTRAAAPTTQAAARTTAPRATTAPKTTKAAGGASYYKNCDAVRAAGKAPLLRGQPGYARHLDGDNDGVACE